MIDCQLSTIACWLSCRIFARVAVPKIKVGSKLPGDRWTVEDLFAEGRRYRLYAGSDGHLDGKRVAIKVPRAVDAWATADSARAVFEVEGEFLTCPTALIPEPLDFLDVDGWPVLVTEFISGDPLAAQIKAGREIGVVRAIAVVRELLAFATEIRARGFVFGDFSPDHVLLGLDDVVHVVGTGNAVRITEGDAQRDIVSLGQLLATLAPDAPPAVERIAERATAAEVNLADFARALASLRIEVARPAPVVRKPVSVAEAGAGAVSEAAAVAGAGTGAGRRRWAWIAAALIGIAGAAAAVYFLAFHGR